MNADRLADAFGEINEKYVTKAKERKYVKKGSRIITGVLIAAAVIAVLMAGAFAVDKTGFMGWIQRPSTDPAEAVTRLIENEALKDYCLGVEVVKVNADPDETARMVGLCKGSELAQQNGWTDKYLDKHFVAVYAEYRVKYDHTKTWERDGHLWRYFYMVEGKDGNWVIWDATSDADLPD